MIRRLFAGWFRPFSVSPLEGFFMRLLFAMALLYALRMPVNFHSEPHPVGILRILHGIDDNRTWLTWLSDPHAWEVFHWAFIGLMVLYVAGIALPVVLPVAAILEVLPYTLLNSQGANYHGAAMISFVLCIQAATVLYHFASKRFSLSTFLPPDAKLRSWLLLQSVTIVTGAYFLSVITKMQNSHGMWLFHADHIALDMVKTQRQSFYNHLDPTFAGTPPEALWMLQHAAIARILFSSGVILETICILAIGNRVLALLIGVSLIAMHRSIDWLMGGVAFPLNELCDFIFLIGLPFGFAWLLERLKIGWVRYGILIGTAAGIIASVAWHRHLGRYPTPPAEYLLSLIYHTCGVWASMDWREYFQFITPALCMGLAGGCLAGGLEWLAARRSLNVSARCGVLIGVIIGIIVSATANPWLERFSAPVEEYLSLPVYHLWGADVGYQFRESLRFILPELWVGLACGIVGGMLGLLGGRAWGKAGSKARQMPAAAAG